MSEQWEPTACILCECNCGIVVQTSQEGGDRRISKIRGDKDHPGTRGYTCNKALRLDYYQSNPNRLRTPLRRRPDGSYEEIDWDTAISEVAEGFRRIADEHGRYDFIGPALLACVVLRGRGADQRQGEQQPEDETSQGHGATGRLGKGDDHTAADRWLDGGRQ